MKTSHAGLITLLFLSGATALYSAGCETRVSVVEVEPPAETTYACAAEDGGYSVPVDLCQSSWDTRLNRHGECRGWRTWTANGRTAHSGDCMTYSVCKFICETDSDCPAPANGTAQPSCSTLAGVNYCLLGCDNGETCPAGLTCVEVDPSGLQTPPAHQCVSITHTEAEFTDNHDGFGGAAPMVCTLP